MKSIQAVLLVAFVSALALVGCEKKQEVPAVPTPPAVPAAPTK